MIMKKVCEIFLIGVAILAIGLAGASYVICENTIPAWIVLGITIVALIILYWKKVRKRITFAIILLLVVANVGTFHLTNKISFLGGIISKVAAPIVAQDIGKGFTLNREETAKENALDASAEWEVPEGYDYEKINRWSIGSNTRLYHI